MECCDEEAEPWEPNSCTLLQNSYEKEDVFHEIITEEEAFLEVLEEFSEIFTSGFAYEPNS